MIFIDCANYNIRFMMNQNNKVIDIKRPFPKIDDEVIDQIRRQIEYYFTMANLVTDKVLKRMIESNHRGWVNITDLMQFNRLRMLVTKAFQKYASPKEIEHLVAISVQDSEKVKAVKGRIKLKKHLVWERQFKRVLYFQGECLAEEGLVQLLTSLQIGRQGFVIKSGNGWFFVEFLNLNQLEVSELYANIQSICAQRNIKTLRMDEFQEYQKRYNQLFRIEHDKNIQTSIRIPPRQLLQCDQIEVKVHQKAQKQKSPNKNIDYDKIFSKYVKSRNKKTPEAYEKHRAEKIAEKQRAKAMKLNMKIEKMEIEQ